MKNIRLYIDNELADFNDEINVKAKVFDILDDEFGYYFKSYTLDLPLTERNQRLLKFLNLPNTPELTTIQARIHMDDINVINGNLKLVSSGIGSIKVMIEAAEWYNALRGIYIDELWTSGDDHTFNGTNIAASWSAAAGALYRYPLIYYGLPPRGFGSDIDTNYFTPMWSIYHIFLRLMAEAGLDYDTNNWFISTYAKALYILFPWRDSRPDSFLVDKEFESNVSSITSNRATISHITLTTNTVTLNKTLDFDTEVDDPGGHWNTTLNRYTIDDAGTYRFAVDLYMYCDHNEEPQFSGESQYLRIRIYRNDGSTDIIIAQYVESGSNVFDGTLEYLDTGYFHCEAGDYIYATIYAYSQAYNSGATLTVQLMTLASAGSQSRIYNVVDNWCRSASYGCVINPSDYLPHITGIEFLKAIKKIFGLIFWYDQFNNKVYALPFNDFLGDTIIYLTGSQDFMSSTELRKLSVDYPYRVEFKYLPDAEDWIYANATHFDEEPSRYRYYLSGNDLNPEGSIFQNDIFSTCPKYLAYGIQNRYIEIAAIYGGEEITSLNGMKVIDGMPINFAPKLLEWFGDVSPSEGSIDWDWYDEWGDGSPTNKTTYPKAETPEMEDNFALFSKRFYIIDNKRSIDVTIRMTPMEFLKFVTVFNDAANEGFRALYKLNINGQDGLYIVQSVTFDGAKAKLELIQR